MPLSVVGTIMGLPLALDMAAPSFLLKSPVRKSLVGTEKSAERPTRSKVPSQSVKKNTLLFLMGPPRLPPSIFRMPLGLSFTPARFSSQVYARSALLLWNANALPWNGFVPDFVVTLTPAPPVIPSSASKLLLHLLTSSTLPPDGTYPSSSSIVNSIV